MAASSTPEDNKTRMSSCLCLRNLASSEDSDEVNKDERWGYWFGGVTMGPDTVNATWWTGVILALAASDSTCGTNPGTVESVLTGESYVSLSSGADGQMCTPHDEWNHSEWILLNGSSCLAKTGGIDESYHNLPNAACQAAFASYRMNHKYTYVQSTNRDVAVVSIFFLFILRRSSCLACVRLHVCSCARLRLHVSILLYG